MAKAERHQLWSALDHAALVSRGAANYSGYCLLQGHWLVGYDGTVAAGSRVEEELGVAPDTDLFRAAIARVGTPYSLTLMPDTTLAVRGNALRASIPTFPLLSIPNVVADNPQIACGEELRRAIVAVSKIATNKSDIIVECSVALGKNSAVATDGSTILEALHNNNLPLFMLLPREFGDVIAKVKAVPTHCGWTDQTFTMWFGEMQWVRTNAYPPNYPDTNVVFSQVLSQCGDFRPVPVDLSMAIESLKPFRQKDTFIVTDTGLTTGYDSARTSYNIQHFWTFRGEYPIDGLRVAAMFGRTIAFGPSGAYWQSDNVRGVTVVRQANG